MDLSEIKSGEIVHRMVHPGNGKDLGIIVTLVSLDDPRVLKVKRRVTDRRLHLEARGKSFKAEELDENMNNVVFACMTGWSWENDEDGEPALFHGKKPEFNSAVVNMVFTELPWFLSQIREVLNEDKDFYKASK